MEVFLSMHIAKSFFFAPFLFVNHGKGETKEPLVSKNKASYW